MYSTCIFCHSDLGTNESIERFPVGRRLAFDAARGRLWVVCRKCERWNLTPVEERWEAIEECERLFRDTKLRVSTDNIGLARLREGLELVRVGEPQRPEMAAWRYGDQFGRRRQRHMAYTAGGVAIAAGLVILGPATGVIAGSSWGLWNLFSMGNTAYQQRRVRARLTLPDVEPMAEIRLKQLNRISLVGTEGGWGLRIPYEAPTRLQAIVESKKTFKLVETRKEKTTLLTGEEALRAAAKILPAINVHGAKRNEVQTAVGLIERTGAPTELFTEHALRTSDTGLALSLLPKEVRLAMEMATHEDSERRALEGELSLLEEAWREAEEIAAIADDLFVSDDTRQRLSSLKRDGDTP
jgi:hypothetical protein